MGSIASTVSGVAPSTDQVTKALNFGVEYASNIAISTVSFFIVIVLLIQMISYGRTYKNIHRFFRTTVTFSASGNTLSNTRDPYNVVEKPSTTSSVTLFTLTRSGYYFAGSNVKAYLVSDGGGFVSVTKPSATTLSLTPYRIMAPIQPTAVSNSGGSVTFTVPYGGQYFEVGDTFVGSGFTSTGYAALNATHTVVSSTATTIVITNAYSGATDTGGTLTLVFPKLITSGTMDIYVTFPQLASK
jgi:hypothetical protein